MKETMHDLVNERRMVEKIGDVASVMLSYRRMRWTCEPHHLKLLHQDIIRFLRHCILRAECLTLLNFDRITLGTIFAELIG